MPAYRIKPASLEEIKLYCHIGEAVCMIQLVEEALNTFITLKHNVKKPHTISRNEADKIRDKHRSKTLGRAINLTRKENLLPESLQEALDKFLLERNWLIHKSIQNEDEMLSEPNVSRIVYSTRNERCFQHGVEHRFRSDSNTDSGAARTVA